MSIVFLKVRCIEEGGGDASENSLLYRTLDVSPDNTILEVVMAFKQKYNLTDSATCLYGLFLPDEGENPDSASLKGRWLHHTATVHSCALDTGKRIVDFRNALRSLKVTDLAGDVSKQVVVNATGTLASLLAAISLRFSISQPRHYCLQVPRGDQMVWLDQNVSLCDQLFEEDKCVILRKRLFLSDCQLKRREPYSLHLIFLECRQGVVAGEHPISLRMALNFAALQMQVTYRDYDPLLHVHGFLTLAEFLPPEHRDVTLIEEDIYKEHRKLKDCKEGEAKTRYVRLLATLPTFGLKYFSAKEKLEGSRTYDHDLLVGLTSEAVLCLHPQHKAVLAKYSLTQMSLEASLPDRMLRWHVGKDTAREFQLDAEHLEVFLALYQTYQEIARDPKHELQASTGPRDSSLKLFARLSSAGFDPSGGMGELVGGVDSADDRQQADRGQSDVLLPPATALRLPPS